MEDLSHYNAPGTTLRAAQLRMLDILKEIDKICKKHHITYWLDGGSMLGCARHKGFIPWDDDLDIAVFEEDYKRLLSALQTELPKQLRVEWTGNNKNVHFNFAKVVDSNSYVQQNEDGSMPRNGITGLWVDIFPMIHSNRPVRQIVEPIYGRCYRRIHNFDDNKLNKMLAYLLYPFALLLLGLAKIFCFLFVSKDKYVNSYGTGKAYAQYSTRHRSWTIPTIEMQFEDSFFPMPCNYDAVLTRMYGDYMKIPPVEKREIHSKVIKVY
jgi:lipopolysaccharide cholinephosphotransferase